MKKYFEISVFMVAIFTLASCKKNNEEPAPLETAKNDSKVSVLSYSGVSGLYGSTVQVFPVDKDQKASIRWTEIQINLSEITLAATLSGSPVEYKSIPETSVFGFQTLANGISKITLPKGVYADARLKVEMKNSLSNPSFVAYGLYRDQNGYERVVSFTLSEDMEIAQLLATPININNNTSRGNLSFNWDMLGTSLQTIDFPKETEKDAHTPIIINASNNIVLYNKIKANIASLIVSDIK